MAAPQQPTITITPDGPYMVTGAVPLTTQTIGVNVTGESITWEQGQTFAHEAAYALCRCGASSQKPFCDGTHAKIHFDGTETASRAPYAEQADIVGAAGKPVALADAESLCAFARMCDPNGQVWSLVNKTDDPVARAVFEAQVDRCPGGRLSTVDALTNTMIEVAHPHAIGLVEDPDRKCSGPIWVAGGIPITGADGQIYEVRNRVTLCRCGASNNKPFCDGTHATIGFLATT
jgi:CDGSH-type Zn-finger protein